MSFSNVPSWIQWILGYRNVLQCIRCRFDSSFSASSSYFSAIYCCWLKIKLWLILCFLGVIENLVNTFPQWTTAGMPSLNVLLLCSSFVGPVLCSLFTKSCPLRSEPLSVWGCVGFSCQVSWEGVCMIWFEGRQCFLVLNVLLSKGYVF